MKRLYISNIQLKIFIILYPYLRQANKRMSANSSLNWYINTLKIILVLLSQLNVWSFWLPEIIWSLIRLMIPFVLFCEFMKKNEPISWTGQQLLYYEYERLLLIKLLGYMAKWISHMQLNAWSVEFAFIQREVSLSGST